MRSHRRLQLWLMTLVLLVGLALVGIALVQSDPDPDTPTHSLR